MSYPQSFDVQDSQPTSYQQYNRLRSDALRLGAAESDSVLLAELLGRYESGLRLEYLPSNRVRLPASPQAPVCLLVDGVPLCATAHIDLPAGQLAGPAASYYVFAVRTAGSSAFTLQINTTPTESANRRRIGSFYWDGAALVPGSILTEQAAGLHTQLNLHPQQPAGGRLTLAPGNPLPAGDVTGAGVVYYTPYCGNRTSLYVPGFGWQTVAFDPLSVSLAGKPAGRNLDVYLYDSGAGLALQLVDWSSDNSRAIQLAWQDGILVKSGDPTHRYLGTLRTTGAGIAEDSLAQRYLWNWENRLQRPLKVIETTNTWMYNTFAYRPMNNSLANRVQFITGYTIDPVHVEVLCEVLEQSGVMAYVGLAIDTTDADGSDLRTGVVAGQAHALLHKYFSPGYHYVLALEAGGTAGWSNFYGDNGLATTQSGLSGYLFA
ncbi:MAG: hypothetical protein VB089_07995 [Anaerolineaceae bacterium]|nr:hypothetical protein [Anaerolineaceae bacterium]